MTNSPMKANTVRIPLYKLTAKCVYGTTEEVRTAFKRFIREDETEVENSYGYTCFRHTHPDKRLLFIGLRSDDKQGECMRSIFVHELYHAVQFIARSAGMEKDEEALALLIGFLHRKLYPFNS